MEKSTIRVRGGQDFFGMVRKLKIIIDEKHVADLKWDKAIDIHVKPGFHTVRVKMDWCTCRPAGLKLDSGEQVEFKVEAGFDESITNMFKQLYNVFFNASDFFTLKQQ